MGRRFEPVWAHLLKNKHTIVFDANLTEREKMKNRIFILAHPDDEVFCLPFLLDKEYRNYLVYLTSGKLPGQSTKMSDLRQQELSRSLKLLKSRTVIEQIVLKNTTQDSVLYLDVNFDLLHELIECIHKKRISECCTMKFEGGHQDHDFANIIARLLSEELNLTLREFVMYSASNRKKFNFKINLASSVGNELKFNRMRVILLSLRMMRIYRSQWKSWIGLSAPLIYSYIRKKWRDGLTNPSDPIKVPDLALYEIRGRAVKKDVIKSIEGLRIKFKELIMSRDEI